MEFECYKRQGNFNNGKVSGRGGCPLNGKGKLLGGRGFIKDGNKEIKGETDNGYHYVGNKEGPQKHPNSSQVEWEASEGARIK